MNFYALIIDKNQVIIAKDPDLLTLRKTVAKTIRFRYEESVRQRAHADGDTSDRHKEELYARASEHYFKNKTIVKVTMEEA